MIYKPCVLERIENFVLRKEPGTNDVEPKLKNLSDRVSKMFSDDVKYTGILSNVNKKLMNFIFISGYQIHFFVAS